MPFQIGTNWSRYADAAGNVLGPLFSYEGLTAFFLEAAFLGVLLFGRRLVPLWAHFVAALMAASGTLFSSFWKQAPRYFIRDRDASYAYAVTRRLAAMGIRDRPTAPRSPWQNGHAERLIGSIRKECLDHVVILGELHLRRILAAYADYYNGLRTHRSLAKDAPLHRIVERLGSVASRPILGGLHHQYCRI
jgi:hypothetical protein